MFFLTVSFNSRTSFKLPGNPEIHPKAHPDGDGSGFLSQAFCILSHVLEFLGPVF